VAESGALGRLVHTQRLFDRHVRNDDAIEAGLGSGSQKVIQAAAVNDGLGAHGNEAAGEAAADTRNQFKRVARAVALGECPIKRLLDNGPVGNGVGVGLADFNDGHSGGVGGKNQGREAFLGRETGRKIRKQRAAMSLARVLESVLNSIHVWRQRGLRLC
jgi:hypothetical protein